MPALRSVVLVKFCFCFLNYFFSLSPFLFMFYMSRYTYILKCFFLFSFMFISLTSPPLAVVVHDTSRVGKKIRVAGLSHEVGWRAFHQRHVVFSFFCCLFVYVYVFVVSVHFGTSFCFLTCRAPFRFARLSRSCRPGQWSRILARRCRWGFF